MILFLILLINLTLKTNSFFPEKKVSYFKIPTLFKTKFYKNVFKNKRIINFYDQEIFIPSIDDLILHLLVHFSLNSELSNELKVVSDIKILEKKYCIDWIKFFEKIDNNIDNISDLIKKRDS